MRDKATIEISGLTFTFTRLGGRAQVEIECILGRVFGPAFAAGISVIAGEIAEQLAIFARAVTKTEDAASFDLQRLIPVIRAAVANKTATLEDRIMAAFLDAGTDNADLRLAWISLTNAAPEIAKTILTQAAPELAKRLDPVDALRMFDLAVFGHVSMADAANVSPLRSWDDLDALTKRHPRIKWAILVQSLWFTYIEPKSKPAPDPEDE